MFYVILRHMSVCHVIVIDLECVHYITAAVLMVEILLYTALIYKFLT